MKKIKFYAMFFAALFVYNLYSSDSRISPELICSETCSVDSSVSSEYSDFLDSGLLLNEMFAAARKKLWYELNQLTAERNVLCRNKENNPYPALSIAIKGVEAEIASKRHALRSLKMGEFVVLGSNLSSAPRLRYLLR